MKMKSLYLIIATCLTCNAIASDNLGVELYKKTSSINLKWDHKLHLYENTIGYMSTCHHLDKVIGKVIPVDDEKKAFILLAQGDYIRLSFGENKPRFPISAGLQEVSNIYVGIRSDGMPNIITENEGNIQIYAKCQGHYAVLNYSCDSILSKLLGFDINQKLCASLK